MRKFVLSFFFAASSFASFANTSNITRLAVCYEKSASAFTLQVRIAASYTSKCGVTWNIVAYGSSYDEAMQGLKNMAKLADAACGTNISQIIVPN